MPEYVIWRSDSPLNIYGVMSTSEDLPRDQAIEAAVLAAQQNTQVDWCVIEIPDDNGDWLTILDIPACRNETPY
jgi:hypothetical protein